MRLGRVVGAAVGGMILIPAASLAVAFAAAVVTDIIETDYQDHVHQMRHEPIEAPNHFFPSLGDKPVKLAAEWGGAAGAVLGIILTATVAFAPRRKFEVVPA